MYYILSVAVLLTSLLGVSTKSELETDLLKTNDNTMEEDDGYGIEGDKAPELEVARWIDGDGKEMDAPKLANNLGKYTILFCYQSWCPGCHSAGLPALKKMADQLKGNRQVEFLAVQTVFEGFEANTFDKIRETQIKYDLKIPFGHDVGDASTENRSSIMYHYRTGGTPWFVFIDPQGTVIFNDFRINTDGAIQFLEEQTIQMN
jgi:thiol-disulfide isomerase/thioredoxin